MWSKLNKFSIHKWSAVVLGLFLLMWAVTGVLMVLPAPYSGPPGGHRSPELDYAELEVSPARAIAAVRAELGEEVEVSGVQIRNIHGRAAYEVGAGGRSHLIDARTAEPLEVTADLAGRIARAGMPANLAIEGVERLEQHEVGYPWGALPVYRVRFADGKGTRAYVSTTDGSVAFTNRAAQIRSAIISLHDFYTLRVVVSDDRVRRALLILFGLGSLVVIGSGYYLVIALRGRRLAIQKASAERRSRRADPLRAGSS